MQKKQYWNVKTLVFMALLIAMHLVLTRVLVIDLGAYRISVGSVTEINLSHYSTVTDLARLRGLSTSQPRVMAV